MPGLALLPGVGDSKASYDGSRGGGIRHESGIAGCWGMFNPKRTRRACFFEFSIVLRKY